MNKPAKFPYSPHIAFQIESIKDIMSILTERNVNIIAGPFEDSYGTKWIFISDPDNNIIEYIRL